MGKNENMAPSFVKKSTFWIVDFLISWADPSPPFGLFPLCGTFFKSMAPLTGSSCSKSTNKALNECLILREIPKIVTFSMICGLLPSSDQPGSYPPPIAILTLNYIKWQIIHWEAKCWKTDQLTDLSSNGASAPKTIFPSIFCGIKWPAFEQMSPLLSREWEDNKKLSYLITAL